MTLQVGISIDITIRDREDIEMLVERSAFDGTTHPFPLIFTLTAKLVVTNQIHTATAFVTELTTPFITNLVE